MSRCRTGSIGRRTRLHFRARAAFAGIALWLSACAPLERRSAIERSDPPCSFEETAWFELRTAGGRRVYVEPQTVAGNGRSLLIAGTPVYQWVGEGRATAAAPPDSAIGAIVSGDGSMTLLQGPMPTSETFAVRAAALANGHWAIAFGEGPSSLLLDPELRVPRAYWLGVTDGRRWLRLERIPFEGGRLRGMHASSLVAWRGDLVLAVPYDLPDHWPTWPYSALARPGPPSRAFIPRLPTR